MEATRSGAGALATPESVDIDPVVVGFTGATRRPVRRAAGLAKPDISILSEEFLSEVRGMPQRNLAVERKYGYPPDKQEKATETVLEQAVLLSDEWAVG